ncbi:hypothetical protein C475_08982 [Halosimplex carlsbadense 2-9-1]|uniref:Pyrrolo-quinoline quinone n=1 Tax=Halosimplex carlsbadense 2-9-1 TaxID=797114 RepID=M0CVC0_9EURY|nr:PQQ-binding-like beta-propeller repeat protein [Halosimplex carlsbadense]ELZ26548.1 hypothetical protein C475_08982 [Halosimplex carlsbadense 2-9-1]
MLPDGSLDKGTVAAFVVGVVVLAGIGVFAAGYTTSPSTDTGGSVVIEPSSHSKGTLVEVFDARTLEVEWARNVEQYDYDGGDGIVVVDTVPVGEDPITYAPHVLRLDASTGEVMWAVEQDAEAVVATSDGGAVAVDRFRAAEGEQRVRVVRFDDSGAVQWEHVLRQGRVGSAAMVDGTVVVSVLSESADAQQSHVYAIDDAGGDVVESRRMVVGDSVDELE